MSIVESTESQAAPEGYLISTTTSIYTVTTTAMDTSSSHMADETVICQHSAETHTRTGSAKRDPCKD